jgi:putative protease
MMSSSPKSSGIQIGTVADYDKSRRVCTIRLSADVTGGDGIEVWTQKGPHTGTNISHKAAAGSVIKLFLDGQIQKGDKVFLSYDKRLNDKLKNTYGTTSRQRPVDISFKAIEGENMRLSIPAYGIVTEGGTVQGALNQPMTADKITDRLQKTGGTPFAFNVTECEISDNIYIPVAELNEIRRIACKKLEEKMSTNLKRGKITVRTEKYTPEKADKPKISVLTSTADQFAAALEAVPDRIYYTAKSAKDLQKAASEAHKKGIELFAAMPHISRDCNADNEEYVNSLAKTSVDGFLVRSFMKMNTQKTLVPDYTLNVTNSYALKAAQNIFGADTVTLSTELNLKELKPLAGIDTEVVVYGRIPLMTTQQCPVGLYCGEKHSGKYCSEKDKNESYILSDRKKAEFPIKTQCALCYALIYNSAPIYMLNKADDVLSLGAGMLRLELTTESFEESKRLIEEHKDVLLNKKSVSFIPEEQTKGHFYRGVN